MQFKVKCSELLGTVKDSALLDGYLTLDDLKRIQAALDFLLPVFPAEREAQKIFRAAILKTKAMLKKKTKKIKQKSHMRPACFLLWYAQHGRRSVVKTNARSVVRFLFQFCEDTDILQCRKFRLFPSR